MNNQERHFEEEKRYVERLRRLSGEQDEKAIIGHEIAKLRHEKAMTQAELARKLGTTQSSIARMEKGRQNLTVRTLVKIGIVFGRKLEVAFLN